MDDSLWYLYNIYLQYTQGEKQFFITLQSFVQSLWMCRFLEGKKVGSDEESPSAQSQPEMFQKNLLRKHSHCVETYLPQASLCGSCKVSPEMKTWWKPRKLVVTTSNSFIKLFPPAIVNCFHGSFQKLLWLITVISPLSKRLCFEFTMYVWTAHMVFFFHLWQKFSPINCWELLTALFKVPAVIFAKIDQCSNTEGWMATRLIDLR